MEQLYSNEFINSRFIEQVEGYAIFATDTEGIITTWNKGAELLKGYKEDEAIGKYYGMLFPDEYQKAGKPENEIKTALQEGIFENEDWRRRKDGSLFWATVKLTPIYSNEGQHIGFTKVTGDITKLKELKDKLAERYQTALEHKNNELQKINLDLDSFIYTASHDLRSPISNIEALTSLLKDELLDAGIQNESIDEVLHRIDDSVDRFKKTIADLTEISKLEKDISSNPSDEVINVQEVYEDIIADIDLHIQFKGCFMETDFIVHQIKFSKKNFRSILYNLISNAIKYKSPRRDCIIGIHTRLEEPYVVLSVQDNGLGISKHNQDKLFSMFRRFHDHVEGTGVGLYMVKRLVENAGGKIEVHSKEGEGSEFIIYFKSDIK